MEIKAYINDADCFDSATRASQPICDDNIPPSESSRSGIEIVTAVLTKTAHLEISGATTMCCYTYLVVSMIGWFSMLYMLQYNMYTVPSATHMHRYAC